MFYSQPLIKAFTDSRHLEELYSRYKGKIYIRLSLLDFFSFCKLVKGSETMLTEIMIFYEHESNSLLINMVGRSIC